MSAAAHGGAEVGRWVFAWAARTLAGGTGYGLVATSPGAVPAQVAAPEFVPPERLAALAGLAAPLTAVVFRPGTPDGTVVELKKDLGPDGSGRPGRRVVEVLVDPAGELDGRTLARAAGGLLAALDWPMDAEPTTGLGRVELAAGPAVPAAGAEPAGAEDAVPPGAVDALLAAAVEAVRGPRRIVLLGVPEPAAVPVLRAAWDLLPSAWVARLGYATYWGRTETTDVDVTLASAVASVVRRGASPQVGYRAVVDGLCEQDAAAVALLRGMDPAGRDRIVTAEDLDHLVATHLVQRSLDVPAPQEADVAQAVTVVAELSAQVRQRLAGLVLDRAARLEAGPVAEAVQADGGPLRDRAARVAGAAAADLLLGVGADPAGVCAAAVTWGVSATDLLALTGERLRGRPVGAGQAGALPGEVMPVDEAPPLGVAHQAVAQWLVGGGLPVAVLLDRSDEPLVSALLDGWGPVAAQLAVLVWTDPAWTQEHRALAEQVAWRHPDELVTALLGLLRSGRVRAEDVRRTQASAGAGTWLHRAAVRALPEDRTTSAHVVRPAPVVVARRPRWRVVAAAVAAVPLAVAALVGAGPLRWMALGGLVVLAVVLVLEGLVGAGLARARSRDRR
ncbi:MAG TPA: hypothetical protein VGC67_09805 [Cellulomonas sp.]